MKTKQEILNTLPNFYGTESYYKWSMLFPRFVMTDGAKYIADSCDAYWLMDAIASHFKSYKTHGFAVAKLKQHSKGFVLRIEDGDDNALERQTIEYSDFPLDEIMLYVVDNGDFWVILLPSEY